VLAQKKNLLVNKMKETNNKKSTLNLITLAQNKSKLIPLDLDDDFEIEMRTFAGKKTRIILYS